jgi:hypothetical protein
MMGLLFEGKEMMEGLIAVNPCYSRRFKNWLIGISGKTVSFSFPPWRVHQVPFYEAPCPKHEILNLFATHGTDGINRPWRGLPIKPVGRPLGRS